MITTALSSCVSTKYVSDGDYLLDDYSIKYESKKLKKEDLKNYIRQKPNKTILGMKFHLGLYNLSPKEKESGFITDWLRTIGEAPVIYDEFSTSKTSSQMELYFRNKGYYNSIVKDSVIFKKKKAKVIYKIASNEPYRIRNINYSFEDTSIYKLIINDKANCLFKEGELFDVDVLADERERIELYARTKGYYYFSKEYIFYQADSSLKSKQVDIEIIVKKYKKMTENGGFTEHKHPLTRIKNVYIHTNYQPKIALSNYDEYASELDTIISNGVHLIYRGSPNIKSAVVTESNFIQPEELYNLTNVSRSYRNLSALHTFRLVNINFKENLNNDFDGEKSVDCEILLTPSILQSFTVEVEGTNSSGNIGAAGNLIYQHRNLFKGAENFDLRFKGAMETLKESYSADFGNMVEIGSEMRVSMPKFILPFKTDQFIRKFNPSTSVSLAYNFQKRPDYTRTIANASFGYNWKGNRFLTHIINPIELNFVKIPYKSQEFIDWLEGKYIFYSYQPHLVSVTNYSLIYTNQNIQKSSNFQYLRLNLESAGNILATSYNIMNIESEGDNYKLLNTEFAQYVRGDIDLRHYNVINEHNSIVYRFFAGAGLPYNNSTALPFEKKYFAGGANSIRAWQVRNLGPGSYAEEETSTYPNKTADIKLEANLEYRFKLFWVLEGALFVDAGNIWAINSSDEREGALFTADTFYKEIAIGTGFGTRFDFSFFVFRLDLGVKAMDPAEIEGQKWIIGKRKMTSDDFTVNIGIGYPF